MNEVLLYPRLPLSAARARLQDIKGLVPVELISHATSVCAEAVYAATGGNRLPAGTLDAARLELVEQAQRLGFPEKAADPGTFDWAAASVLTRTLRMTPGEASRTDVWSFIAICLLPDVATWRFPKQNERRFLGGERNAFQRLWWRAHLLKDDQARDPWQLVRLPEDALVGLMERPGISSNGPVTRAIARAIAHVAESLPPGLRDLGWRRAYKKIRQRVPLVNLDCLTDDQLREQLGSICNGVIEDLRNSAPRMAGAAG